MNRGFLLMRSLVASNFRNRNYSVLPSEAVIYLDRETIVCWHPEQPFPYECSKPLPKIEESRSVLKIGQREINEIFKEEKMPEIAEELAKLTQTTKHRWFPRCRDNKRKKKPLPDRKYL